MSFFKVERGWQDSDVWGDEPYSPREAWLWMVAAAEWQDTTRSIVGKPVMLKRGQYSHSIRFMAEKFQWSTNRVLRYLEKLKMWNMIEAKTETGQIIITICNYSKYQDGPDSSGDTSGDGVGDRPGDTSGDKEEELQEGKEENINTSAAKPKKITLEELTVDHIRVWLNAKRAIGKYLTVDEDRLLEKFKDYCRAKGPKYKDLVAAFRNSFEWDNAPKKGEENGKITVRQPTKTERAKRALDQAVSEIHDAGGDGPASEAGGAELRDFQHLRQGTGGAGQHPPRLLANPERTEDRSHQRSFQDLDEGTLDLSDAGRYSQDRR